MKKQGTTLECFEDLVERVALSDSLEKRKLLAHVLGVEDITVKRWITGPSVPVGLSMISLRYYLDFMGYQLDELIAIPPTIQDAGRLLAFRVLTTEELAKLTGFEEYPDSLISILRGVRGISVTRETQLREVIAAYRKELADKMLAVPKLVTLEGAPKPVLVQSVTPSLPVVVAVKSIVPQSKSKADNKRDERFKGLVLNLLDFAQFYAHPEVPEEVRDQLRDVVGQKNIFDLKNLLARLCGAKAFSNQQ